VASLFAVCGLFYYFGQVADLLNWQWFRWDIWYTVHDFHRLLFLAPIILGGWYFGYKGVAVISLLTIIIFIPRALWFSPFPDSLTRALLMGAAEGIGGCLVIFIWRRKGVQTSSPGEPGETVEETYAVADLEVNLSKRWAKRRGQIVKLTRTEYELLSCLVRNHGKIMKHEELLRAVWGNEYGREKEYLHTFIGQLRKKIEDDPSKPQFIQTEAGRGYRFTPLQVP